MVPTLPTSLTPEQEQHAIEAITNLDWKSGVDAFLNAVAVTLEKSDEDAQSVVEDLNKRGLIKQGQRCPGA